MVVLAPPEVEPGVESAQRLTQGVSQEGKATFEEVPYGPYRVCVYFRETRTQPFQPTLPPAIAQDLEVGQKEVEFTIPVTGVPCLLGHLTEADGQTPVADKPVLLYTMRPNPREGTGGRADYRFGQTNDEGRFAFPQPPAEPCVLEVFLADNQVEGMWERWIHELARLTPQSEGNTEREFSLPAFPSVTGRIFDLDGKPLADTEVNLLFQALRNESTYGMIVHLTTSPEGAYRVDRIPLGVRGSYVWVSGKGYVLGGPLAGREGKLLEGVDFQLKPFATVTLTFRESDGDPVANWGLSAMRQTFEGPEVVLSLPQVLTDDQGQCTLKEVPEGYYSFGWPMKYGHPTLSSFSVKPGQKLALTVTFPPSEEEKGLMLHGRVTDARGEPVVCGPIFLDPNLRDEGFIYQPHDPTGTAEDGSFSFPALEVGQHVVLAFRAGGREGEGGSMAWQYFEVAEGDLPPAVVVCFPEGGSPLVGRVTDPTTGAPLEGVSVLALPPVLSHRLTDLTYGIATAPPERAMKWCADPFPHTTTGADGSYTLGPLPPGRYTVVAVGVEFPTSVTEVVIPQLSPEPIRMDFARLPPAARTLALRLLDEEGRPLANAPVRLTARYVYPAMTTDPDGRLHKDLGPGRHDVRLQIEGYEEVRLDAIVLGTEVDSKEMEVRLKPVRYGTVAAKVLWGDTGEPVPGATVQVRLSRSSWPRSPLPSAVTDAEGQATLEQVPTGRYTVLASPGAPGPAGQIYAPARSDEVEVLPGTAPEVTIRLPLAGSVSGTVTDDAGKPKEGVPVTAFPRDEALVSTVDGPATQSGPDGSFTLTGLSPGPWTLTARRNDGLGLGSEEVTIEAGRETRGIQLQAVSQPQGGADVTVTGRVLGPDGRTPAAGALVQLVGALPLGGSFYSLFPVQVVADAAGQFTLRGRGEAPLFVEAWVPGVGVAVSEGIAPGKEPADLPLTVARGGVLQGRVIRTDGSPVARARVVAKRPFSKPGTPGFADEPRWAWTDERGEFRLDGVPPGEWRLYAEIENLRRTLYAPAQVTAGQALDNLELRVEDLIPEMAGRVFGPDGQTPLARARVVFVEDPAWMGGLDTYTDDRGAFRLRWLSLGTYQVAIYPADPHLANVRCPGLELRGPTEIEFRVPRGGTITGRVVGVRPTTGSSGWRVRTYAGPLALADFALTPTGSALRPDGSYRLERLVPGEYTIYYFEGPQSPEPTASVRVTVREGEEVAATDLVVIN
jgi:hypothetical protein